MTASLRMQAWAQSPQALPPPPALPEDPPERGPHISKVSLQSGSCRPQDPASQNLAEPVSCGCSCNSEAVQPEMRASVPELPHSLGGGASAPASVGLGIDATSDNSCLRPPCKTRVSTGRWVVPRLMAAGGHRNAGSGLLLPRPTLTRATRPTRLWALPGEGVTEAQGTSLRDPGHAWGHLATRVPSEAPCSPC